MMLRGFQGRFLSLNESIISGNDLVFLGLIGISVLCLSTIEFYIL